MFFICQAVGHSTGTFVDSRITRGFNLNLFGVSMENENSNNNLKIKLNETRWGPTIGLKLKEVFVTGIVPKKWKTTHVQFFGLPLLFDPNMITPTDRFFHKSKPKIEIKSSFEKTH